MPITKICEECGKPFTVPPSRSSRSRFCSPKCFYKWLEIFERAEYIDTNCLNCGKPIHLLKSRYDDNRGRYCSQKCMIAQRPKPPKCQKVKCKCIECGKEYEIYPSWAKKGEGKFCSRSCVIANTNKNIRLNSPTQIERMLANELNKRGIDYVSEYSISKWVIDFAFPEKKLAIEADGSYWHSLENVIEKDQRKDHDLKEMGWTILRFTEDEIHEDVSKCVDQIIEHL